MRFNIDRRDVLKFLGKGSLTVAAGFGGAIGGVIAEDVWNGFRSATFSDQSINLNHEEARAAESVFFGTGDAVKIFPASFNKFSYGRNENGITPPAKAGVDSLVEALDYNNRLKVVEGLIFSKNFEGNLCLVGGPIANRFTEFLFGQNGESSCLLSDNGAPLRSPVFIDNNLSIDRFVHHGQRTKKLGSESPVWRLNVEGHSLTPDHNRDGILEDYLLITSLPNFLDSSSFELGRRIVVAAGANGPGTRAIRLLLQDIDILNKLTIKASSLDRDAGWQAVIHVSALENDLITPLRLGQIQFFKEWDVDFRQITISRST